MVQTRGITSNITIDIQETNEIKDDENELNFHVPNELTITSTTTTTSPFSSTTMNEIDPLLQSTNDTNTNTNMSYTTSTHFPPFQESYLDMKDLRRDIKVLTLKNSLPYFMLHSSPTRLEARCPSWKSRNSVTISEKNQLCGFVISANRHANGRLYISRAILQHQPTCPIVAEQKKGYCVSATALMETARPFMPCGNANINTEVMQIENNVSNKVNTDTMKPKDTANLMKEQFGVQTTYMTAWRALNAFKKQQREDEAHLYMKIHPYLCEFTVKNPGTMKSFAHTNDSTYFEHAFLCPAPMTKAMQFCRPVLLLSVFRLISSHGGNVLMATTQDAMGQFLPLAIAVINDDVENLWGFFLTQCKQALPDLMKNDLVVYHNRDEDVGTIIQSILPNCKQNGAIDSFLHSCTSPSNHENDSVFSYEMMQWMENLCTKPPLMIFVGWVSKLASTLYERHHEFASLPATTKYPPTVQQRLDEYQSKADHISIIRVDDATFEVVDQLTGAQRIVDFTSKTCTCGGLSEDFPISGASTDLLPCVHTILALKAANLKLENVIPKIFCTESRIVPIDVSTVPSDEVTLPKPILKKRGRPRKVQQIQQSSNNKHERLTCSFCGNKGHNRRTCKVGLTELPSTSGNVTSSSFFEEDLFAEEQQGKDGATNDIFNKRRKVNETKDSNDAQTYIV